MWTPCDAVGDDGLHHCPYESTFTGYAGEMCRTMCGQGVDEDASPTEECDGEEVNGCELKKYLSYQKMI